VETHLLLFRPEGMGLAPFQAALEAALPAGAQLAIALPDDALPALAHVAARDAEVPDALVTLTGEQDATALVALADPARSRIFAGTRHAILPGRDAIRLFFGLRRLPALTRAAFQDYWLNRHADFGRRLIPPYSYHQIHNAAAADSAPGAALMPATYDGIVEVHFPDIAALVHQLSRADVAEGALADEKNFIDHARSRFWAFREIA
jgi:hypothetical protein